MWKLTNTKEISELLRFEFRRLRDNQTGGRLNATEIQQKFYQQQMNKPREVYEVRKPDRNWRQRPARIMVDYLPAKVVKGDRGHVVKIGGIWENLLPHAAELYKIDWFKPEGKDVWIALKHYEIELLYDPNKKAAK